LPRSPGGLAASSRRSRASRAAERRRRAASPSRTSLGAGPVVVSVARLVPIKGLDVLVRACAPRAGDAAPLRLVVVGEGPERPRLRRLADGLGVSLELVGAVPRDEVPAWLGLADVYAQPSRRLANGRAEGMPLATLEALDAGVPVIVSDSGGLAELRAPNLDVRVAGRHDAAALGTALRARLALRTQGQAYVTAV
jgi:phosphatidylinositol alpha-1,6-mannosyltransferase